MQTGSLQVVPSMLDVDLGHVAEALADLAAAGADRVQWDVMDGSFVPRITHGPDMVAALRGRSELVFEAHLMVDRPEQHWRAFADAGCEVVIVHAEATRHLHLLLQQMRAAGVRAGVALNPATPLDSVVEALDLVDHLLLMTVNPGAGGQQFIASMLPKIRTARELIEGAGLQVDVEVDGGISRRTAPQAVEAGANLLVAGSAVQNHPEGRERAITEIRQEALRGLRRRNKLAEEASEGASTTASLDIEAGVAHFNGGRFWEAHEAWEGAWMPRRGTDTADFYKGLVQVAAGCYHYQRRNRPGALAKWRDGAAYLRPYLPAADGLPVAELVAAAGAMAAAVAATEAWPALEMPALAYDP